MSSFLINARSLTADNVPSYSRKHILKSKENIFKPKCNKALKKKLKKYKLRRDGQEDPDIIDVSQTLISSLRIKSPNNQHIITQKDRVTEENRPYNYLSKMVRLKKNATELVSLSPDIHNDQIEDEIISLTPESDRDKKQTDAFKVLMDSRNKSIGSNSPGKEKCVDECQLQTKNEKNDLKAKRILSLNKMAQAKGSLKKLEIEEYREEEIKRQMEDRATRLKNMIVDGKKKNGKKDRMELSNKKLQKETVTPTNQDVRKNKETTKNKDNKTLSLETFDLFHDLKASPSKRIQGISQEDEEFLKKLSPSIRKKENMLCYFQKINKDRRDSETSQDDTETDFQESNKFIIKVKLSSKTKVKKKTKKSNQVINFSVIHDKNKICEPQSHDFKQNCNSHTRNLSGDKIMRNDNVDGLMKQNDSRPKRNSKRPVKYADDFQLTSSDEELHIFTPKKKRKEKCDSQRSVREMTDNSSELTICENSKLNTKNVECKRTKLYNIKGNPKKNKEVRLIKPKTKTIMVTSKATKLAPIFVTKTQLDPVALKAKQKFLHSGVPNQLKKNTIQQTNILAMPDEFHTVVHVQNLSNVNTARIRNFIEPIYMNYTEDIYLNDKDNLFEKLLDLSIFVEHGLPKFSKDVDTILKDIKTFYPKFPVYRTYHLLRGKSKGEFKDCIYPDLDNSVEIFNNMVDSCNMNPDKLNWSDKYKPTAERQVIGNFESIKELRRWLVTWTENNAKPNKNDGTDSSDFYQSDADSRETMKNFNNSIIITGPVGSGKTLSVYAVAAELAIKVIEVNASTKRTGKIMLQDLQEATQSHKVDRGKSSVDYSQKTKETNNCNKESKTTKKRGKKQKSRENCGNKVNIIKQVSNEVSGQENRTGMSLILIDDADIVFDQDDGFCSAISQLIQTSKRPVILVASSLTCPHLQKFVHLAKIIKMRPFLPKMLGTWLDIMCLVDSNMCSPGLGAKTLELFKGDIRKTINYLQFYVTSHKYLSHTNSSGTSQGEEVLKLNADDENSCMSWLESEGWREQNTTPADSDDIVLKYYVKKQLQLLHPLSSLNSFSIWWNLPDILNYSRKHKKENPIEKLSESDDSSDIKELNVIADMLNTISITDLLENSDQNGGVNTTLRPWYSYESASVIDNENFASYNRNNECINNIAFELMTKGISEAQKVLECDIKTEINYPNMSLHRDRDKVVSRHKTLTNCLNASGSLDRRALALDYWSMCRNICRTEKTKTCNNSKRNNRYCHYLKSLNVLCKNDYFDNLSESLG